MPFEKFTQSSRRNVPMVSISKQGDIRLNMAAVHKFGIDEYKYVSFYWDGEAARIGIELINDDARPHVYRIRCVSRNTTWVISAMAFMRYIGFDYSCNRTFMLYRDEETGFLVFDL